MEKESCVKPECCQLIEQLHDEFEDCMSALELAFVERFLFDETKTIEERKERCTMLCELLAVFTGALHLNTIVQSSGIREQMLKHFMED